jgi:serine/threonine protein kinase
MSTYTSEPGTKLAGRYRLVDQISAGSGWTMWKAIDETLARPVSVLTFAPGFPRIQEVVTAARAASRLTDSRLAQVFDVEDGDHAYVVMEWVAGESLADLLAEGPMDPARSCALVAEAARALAGAHAAGQAHLCLTPQSLRWTRSSGVKITGLGIDAALAGAELVNASDPAAADTRNLAALLYAALTGYWPGDSQTSLPAAPTSDGSVCTPRQVSADVPSAIDAVVTRALLQRPVRQGAPIVTPDSFAEEISSVAPPVPLPEPAPPMARGATDAFDGGRRGGYPGGGYADRGGYQNAGYQGGGYPDRGGYPANPDDPSTWNARGGGAPPYQGRYQGNGNGRGGRSGASRAVISVVVVLVLAAVAAAVWGISSSLGKSSGSGSQAGSGTKPSTGASTSAPAKVSTILKPASAQSFNILGQSPTIEDPQDVLNPLTGASPAWKTQQYQGPNFGGLKKGDGYLIDMGSTVKPSSVTVTFATPGDATATLYVSNTNKSSSNTTFPQSGFTAITKPAQVSNTYTFTSDSSATGRYIIIWFTNLPPSNQESIAKIVVRGTAAASAG